MYNDTWWPHVGLIAGLVPRPAARQGASQAARLGTRGHEARGRRARTCSVRLTTCCRGSQMSWMPCWSLRWTNEGASLEVGQYNHSVIGPQPGDRGVLAGTCHRPAARSLVTVCQPAQHAGWVSSLCWRRLIGWLTDWLCTDRLVTVKDRDSNVCEKEWFRKENWLTGCLFYTGRV